MTVKIFDKSWCCAECAVTDARQTGYERGVRDADAAAYARGKSDGMAEAEARIIAWVRGEANEGYNEIQIADALERGEHKK